MGKTRKISELATYKRLSPNCTKPRTAQIRRLTPHHVAGNLSIESTLGLSRFINYDGVNGASTNYAIGSDGRIGLGVEEINRAWTTSSGVNDHQAITFEISNDKGSPTWSISDKALNSWVNLVVDIVKFYGYKRVMYKDKPVSIPIGTTPTEEWIKTWKAPADTMLITLHDWYKDKVCPGPYFKSKLPSLVDQINKRLGWEPMITPDSSAPNSNIQNGCIVQLSANAVYYDGKSIPDWVKRDAWVVSDVKGDRAVLGRNQNGTNEIQSPISTKFLRIVTAIVDTLSQNAFNPYSIKINVSAINVRKGPGIDNPVTKVLINDANTYTIVEEANGLGDSNGAIIKWGKLKSELGWLALMYTKKV